jgi:UDP-N-acetylmuramoyl-tripeptide--D-alanyl-D-alanine ligase
MACAVTVRTLEWVRDALEAACVLERASLPAGAPASPWSGVVIDSRSECSGRVFFALAGERTDGHRHALAAFQAGSPAAVVSDRSTLDDLEAHGAPAFLVRDTRTALTELARAYRTHLGARVVAVTGSSGKTTTKEYVRAVLRAKFRAYASPGNFNSLVGVPVTILGADEHCQYLVCEVGANQRGEIDALGDLLRPDLAVITNIGDAHVGYFGSRAAIAEEKGSILRHLKAGGGAVLPRDDEFYQKLSAIVQGKVSSFGRSPAADFRLANLAFADGALTFTVNGEPLSLAAVGDYNAMNACAAFAVGDTCGVESGRMREAFLSVRPMPGRGRVHAVAGVTLVDESYNASPASMRASLAMLASLPARRRVAVLGDMKELGEATAELHRSIGAALGASTVDRVFWLGEQGALVRAAARAVRPDLRFDVHVQLDALSGAALAELSAGDAVLVKASRACRLDEFVTAAVDALGRRK